MMLNQFINTKVNNILDNSIVSMPCADSVERYTHLEDFHLAGGTIHQLHVAVAVFDVRLDLYPEWNATLPTMLASRELGADAVYLDVDTHLLARVPPEL